MVNDEYTAIGARRPACALDSSRVFAHLAVATEHLHAAGQVVGHVDERVHAVLVEAVAARGVQHELDVLVARMREYRQHAAVERRTQACRRTRVLVDKVEALVERDCVRRDERRVHAEAEARGADAVLEVLRVLQPVRRESHHGSHERCRLRACDIALQSAGGALETQLQQVVAEQRVRALPQLAYLAQVQQLLRHAHVLFAYSTSTGAVQRVVHEFTPAIGLQFEVHYRVTCT